MHLHSGSLQKRTAKGMSPTDLCLSRPQINLNLITQTQTSEYPYTTYICLWAKNKHEFTLSRAQVTYADLSHTVILACARIRCMTVIVCVHMCTIRICCETERCACVAGPCPFRRCCLIRKCLKCLNIYIDVVHRFPHIHRIILACTACRKMRHQYWCTHTMIVSDNERVCVCVCVFFSLLYM